MAQAIVAPTPSQQAAAEALLADPGRWSPGRSKETGRAFWLIRGSQGRSYFTAADGCTCPGFTYRGVCSHQLACIMREATKAARQANRFACVFPDCGEPTAQARTLCDWHRERKARLARELFGSEAA